ncbi:hypothetical protein PROFUN_09336 [Planoprotostelium fungivorum]|uniref:CNNM transmembrane domain-containing protein n=1 Tax=Planoprotostelium fungivorum TaxID=1890364 RepID=A0A2P6NHB8_9EUKA|nr:hypothetical protein PROFUN_13113 [Planoprotostelium fungivorum]PRP83355.1 hypothetical protein PROFUN_09336 [Planoprotostelium fungivorum]
MPHLITVDTSYGLYYLEYAAAMSGYRGQLFLLLWWKPQRTCTMNTHALTYTLLVLFYFDRALANTVNETISCTYLTDSTIQCGDVTFGETLPPPIANTTVNVIVTIALIAAAGLMSGLIIGLISLDELKLRVILLSGTPHEKRLVSRVLPIVRQHHWMLVALLLCNSAAIETLPLFLDKLVDEITAIIISVTVILVFGETHRILPNALCMKFGIAVGAYTSWIVWTIMIVTAPISWPLGKALDFVFGHEGMKRFERQELKSLVKIHAAEGPISKEEASIITGTIDMRHKKVKDCMTPFSSVFMMRTTKKLRRTTVARMFASGFSRILVYEGERQNIKGVLLIKQLAVYDPNTEMTIQEVGYDRIQSVCEDKSMSDMFTEFYTNRSHIMLVRCLKTSEPVGIITLDDVVTQLIGVEIQDKIDRLTPAERIGRVFQLLLKPSRDMIPSSSLSWSNLESQPLLHSASFDPRSTL